MVSSRTQLAGFTDDGLAITDINNITFELNVECENISNLKALQKGNIQLDDEEFFEIWRTRACYDVTRFLIYKLKQVGFGDFNPGEKTELVINKMLESYSVEQCIGLIYSAVKNCYMRYVENRVNKRHAMNSVITCCENYYYRAQKEQWHVKEYTWPYELEQSILSMFIYEKVLKIGEYGLSRCPQKAILREKTNSTFDIYRG